MTITKMFTSRSSHNQYRNCQSDSENSWNVGTLKDTDRHVEFNMNVILGDGVIVISIILSPETDSCYESDIYALRATSDTGACFVYTGSCLLFT